MELFSKDFKDGGRLSFTFSCKGSNIPPSLFWTDAPEKTKSFALIMVDVDSPDGLFLHWFLYNISPKFNKLDKSLVSGALSLKNGFGKYGYGGPCPPVGEEHTYRFMLVALDRVLHKSTDVKKLMAKIEKYTIKQAILTCTYRNHKLFKTADSIIPLEQQRSILQYAPKDKLWKILDKDQAWLSIFAVLPEPYRKHFIFRTQKLGPNVEGPLAKTYIKTYVKLQHLRNAIVSCWNPSDLADSSVWLRKNGFLRRPLMPLNLRAEKK